MNDSHPLRASASSAVSPPTTGRLEAIRGWTRRRGGTRLCREGVYYVVMAAFVFAVALLGRVNLLMMLSAMMLGPFWFSWRLLVYTLRGLEVRRKMPRAVCAGDLLVVDVEVCNTRRRIGSWALVLEDRIEREGRAAYQTPICPEVAVPYVPAGGTCGRIYRGRLPRRGCYVLGPMRIMSRFPFGFFHRTIVDDRTDSLIVYPRLGELTRRWLARRRQVFEGTQQRLQRSSRVSGDFYGVRPWRHGDGRRHIHWRSSARHGTLVVRQFQQQCTRDVAVLVDLWQPAEPSPEQLEHVEQAVSFAATVLADSFRQGAANLWLGTTADPSGALRGPASHALLDSAMATLAVAGAADDDRLPELLRHAASTIRPGMEIILVTTRRFDPADTARFALLARDPASGVLLGQIRPVETANGNLSLYYRSTEPVGS